MKQLKTAKIGYIMISIAFYISGLCCIISPNVMGRNGKVAAGILLIAYGIIKMIGYFSKDLYCLAFQYDLACGIFLIILGVVALSIRNPKEGYMLAGLGILILLDSLLVIQTSLDARRFGMTEWKWFLFFSVLSALYSQDRAINMEERVNENSKTGGNYNECSKYFKETGNRENI